jgi:hypothetical protein
MNFTAPVLLVSAFLASTLIVQAQVQLNFNTAGQFTGNFRKLTTTTNVITETGSAISLDLAGSTTGPFHEYDTDPASAPGTPFVVGDGLRVTFQFRVAAGGSTVGVFFADPTSVENGPSNSLLGLFNINSTGTLDRFRLTSDSANLSTGDLGTVALNEEVDTTVGLSTTTLSDFSLTLTVAGTTPTLAMTVGGVTRSQTFAPGTFDFANGEAVVILRLFDGSTAAGTPVVLDNFAITSIPEPGAASGLALAGLAGALLIRRRRQG